MSELPSQIGPYTITREIGRGGMGVVYLARDTKLDRNVAIKCLPEELADDADRMARFEREAKTLAALNHPRVASIYGLEEVDGRRYLILEYVPGETLDERLERGPIPVPEAMALAIQIAEAIEAAHEQGIIHRDLKPANIKFSAGEDEASLKVLDFGLAKALGEDTVSGSDAETLAQSPTPIGSPTMPGVVLGTAGYLSPEQARGRPVDKRTDIFSLGCVLYEMLTGETLFAGETVSDSIASTLKTDPDFDRLPAETPALVRHVLKRCLERDRSRRLRDIGDVRIEIQNALVDDDATPSGSASSGLHPGLAAAAFLVVGGALGAGFIWFGADRSEPPAPVTRFEIDLQREGTLQLNTGPFFALAPNGQRLAYVLQSDVAASLYVRELDEPEGRLMVSGPILEHPFFSPDGQWIGYFTNDNLMKVAISGGSPIESADVVGGQSRGGSWGPDDTIVFSPDTTSPIQRVSAAGGPVEAITTLDASRQERSHRWPAFVPGHADRIVFTSQTIAQNFDESRIEMLDLSAGTRHVLHENGSYGRVTPDGHLLFALNDTMFGCALTNDFKASTQAPIPVVSELTASVGNGGAQFALSDNGLIIYVVGAQGGTGQSIPVWIDFEGGVETPLFPEPTDLFSPAISPDGSRIAFHEGYGDAIVVYEIRRGIQTPVYPTEFRQSTPVWSPDGKRIVFGGQTEEHFVPSLLSISADGESVPVRLSKGTLLEQFPSDWSRDGTMILFDEPRPDTRRDILVYHVESGDIETVVASPAEDAQGRFSPEGDWIAYQSNLSGTNEIYLRRLDGAGARQQISVGGGAAPRWAPNGTSICYMVSRMTATGRGATLWRVAVDLSAEPPTIGTPELALEVKPSLFGDNEYDIDLSGERILIVKKTVSGDAESKTRIHLVMNWFEELERILSQNGVSP